MVKHWATIKKCFIVAAIILFVLSGYSYLASDLPFEAIYIVLAALFLMCLPDYIKDNLL